MPPLLKQRLGHLFISYGLMHIYSLVFLIVGSHGIPPWGYIHSTEHGPERFQS